MTDPASYQPIRQLGAGGMAEVWLARQYRAEGIQRLVVIKRMLPPLASDRDAALAFLDEARLMASLSHPSIVTLLDLVVVDGAYAMVLEHVDGEDLASIVDRQGALPMGAALAIGLAVAEALAYAHALCDELGDPLGVIHRDVNPTNVLIGRNGAVKLIDFGIAAAETHEHRSRTGVLKGTFGYMAPEQLTGARDLDARADVFGFGALLYEALTGAAPFETAKDIDAARASSQRAPAPVRERRAEVSERLAELVERCLAPDRERRPRDGGELMSALSEALGDARAWTMSELSAWMRGHAPPEPAEPSMTDLASVRFTPARERVVAAPTRPSRAALQIAALTLLGGAVGAIAYWLGRLLAS
ncbi:MAG: serine/threonine-protein kinase [Sandaracinaceae bacterium]